MPPTIDAILLKIRIGYSTKTMITRILGDDVNILIISIFLFLYGSSLFFYDAVDWTYWRYDEAGHLSAAYNLFHGQGLVIDLIDLSAAFRDANIPVLSHYDEISQPLVNKPPLALMFLGGWLTVVGADHSNWLFWATVAGMIFGCFLIFTFYFFIKRYFGKEIILYTIPIIATSPILIWNSLRFRPDILSYGFGVLTVYFIAAKLNFRNILFAGIFASLAELSHPVGFMFGIGSVVYLLVRRKIKFAAVFVMIWLIILSPWLVRSYLLVGDPTVSIGVPIPKSFLKILGVFSVEKEFSNIVSDVDPKIIQGITLINSIQSLQRELANTYGMDFFLLLIPFSFISYLNFTAIKKALSFRKKIILFLLTSITYSLAIVVGMTFSDALVDIHALLLLLVPLEAYLYMWFITSHKDVFSLEQNDVRITIALIVIVNVISFILLSQISGASESRFVAGSLYLVLPLAMMGIKKLVELPTRFAPSGTQKKIVVATMVVLVVIFSYAQLENGSELINIFQKNNSQGAYTKYTHQWIRENFPKSANIATNVPHVLYLNTGHKAVNFYYEYTGDPSYYKWIIKKFDIDYLVFYTYNPNPPAVIPLGDLTLKIIFRTPNEMIYQVSGT